LIDLSPESSDPIWNGYIKDESGWMR